jgi:PPOX class probable F420-dependent enzyme
MATPGLAPFVRQWAALLTTYKRDGAPVGTPVNIAVEGDHAYFRTPDKTGKVKRIRNNPEVDIAPSTVRGNPTGPARRARARLLDADSEENRHAAQCLQRKYPVVQGVLVPATHRLMRFRTLHYELRLLDEQ